MKLLFKPFAIASGLLGGLLARRLFTVIWGRFDDREPPQAMTHEASWMRVLGAQALLGAVQGMTRAAVSRAGASSFHHLTGVWPGEERPEPADQPGKPG